MSAELNDLLAKMGGALQVEGSTVKVLDEAALRANVHHLVEASAFATGRTQGWARFLVRAAALDLGIYPASIHDLYMARGRGEVPMTFTTPAFNLRTLTFYSARAMFRSALKMNAAAMIFEIARSEIGYTAMRPMEYSTNLFAAAIAEGFRGPLFIQGDHFQMSAKRYAADPEAEFNSVCDLTAEAIKAGFYNIDIDTSTLVDIEKPTVLSQQELNSSLSAKFGAFIREHEPKDVTISIGGEIGEVGGHNSTEEELRAYMDQYNAQLAKLAPGKPGLSKISIQTGTSHGGTVLPDGTIAKVDLDFDTLRNLSRVARDPYGLGGTVQHGASTLPEENFNKFVDNEAIEVHLATNFMTMFYNHIPADLKQKMYTWLDENSASERKPGMTNEQFYYKARKNAIGAFKRDAWDLPQAAKDELSTAWENQFDMLFNLLGLKNTRAYVEKYTTHPKVAPSLADYLGEDVVEEMADDLAD